MTAARKFPHAVPPPQPEPARVMDIRRIPNVEHMHRCVQAIRNREHPLWSWNGFTVTEPTKIRRVK